jgi:hypothetical protein
VKNIRKLVNVRAVFEERLLGRQPVLVVHTAKYTSGFFNRSASWRFAQQQETS